MSAVRGPASDAVVPRKVLVAMSGGVDSSVAAALLLEAGHQVCGVTMKLWGGDSDTGCCSVSDVDDARRVAQQLDIDHHVFNFGDDFSRHVVDPYVEAHRRGTTPNPCIECNRHLKFDRLVRRADALGFEAVATGHHARVVATPRGLRVARALDHDKDQSYVLHMLVPPVLDRVLLPVGGYTKAEIREHAARLGLRTAAKPDSQDVCFVTHAAGRRAFLGDRIPLRTGLVVDKNGTPLAEVDAIELVTVGQRRGLGDGAGGRPRYAISVDVDAGRVVAGDAADLLCDEVVLERLTWADASTHPGPPPGLGMPGARSDLDAAGGSGGRSLTAQCSAHGEPRTVAAVHADADTDAGRVIVRWAQPQQRVAPGQSVVLYDGDVVIGGGLAVV